MTLVSCVGSPTKAAAMGQFVVMNFREPEMKTPHPL
jgi:hypothetical protein